MSIKVKDVMRKILVILKPEDTIQECKARMLQEDVDESIIIDSGKKVCGIVTKTDLLKVVDNSQSVSEIMTKNIIFARDSDTTQRCAELMCEHKVHSIPVIDISGSLAGIVTPDELITDYVEDKTVRTPEEFAIRLAITRDKESEETWITRCQKAGFKGVITQVGSNAEKLAIKLRESGVIAAIARGVIEYNLREKLAVSSAMKECFSQLQLISPGLGGGYKVAIVRGDNKIIAVSFGRAGHALANGPESIVMGFSVI